MNATATELVGFHASLERKAAELAHVLRKRDGIAIEKSADQMDEIQYASERELAIRNVDRDSTLLRQVKAALRRIRDGSFRNLPRLRIEQSAQSASPPCHGRQRCIQCQEAADREGQEPEDVSETLVNAA